MRVGILEPDGFSETARARLAGVCVVDVFDGDDLGRFLADKDALFVRLARRVDGALLKLAPKLRFLCSPTTGHAHIDLDALMERGVKLLSLQGETSFLDGIRATPEHALGLMLALLRNYRTAFLHPSNDHWDRDRCRGEELFGQSVGLIGFGRVGRRLATFLKVFEAKVGYCDPNVSETPPGLTRYEDIAALMSASRMIVMAASYRNGTSAIVDSAAVASLTGKYFVNIARGELVDESALLEAVEQGRLAGCAVDVIDNETGENRRPRWIAATDRHNVIVTPHIGGSTFTSMRATEEFIVEKLLAEMNVGQATAVLAG
jgi:D-3-phosphoglycerate dehydrogenase